MDLTDAYVRMLRIRLTEERISELRLSGDIQGSVHLCVGQEAVPVGVTSQLADEDVVFGNYRGHGWALACGVPVHQLIGELAGRSVGVCSGRGGSAYFTAPEYGFYGENAIIGAQLPHAVGAALAGRFDGSGRASITVLGDGAMNQGAVYEALNLAGAMRLPVVFVVENNLYSELTPISAMVADPNLSTRGAAFGVPGTRVDGNDVQAVAEATRMALERAFDGAGPSLIEAMTYRLVGHYIGDAQTYRTAREVDEARLREPLVTTRAALLASGASEVDVVALETEVKAEIDAETERALTAPLSDPTLVKEHLYA